MAGLIRRSYIRRAIQKKADEYGMMALLADTLATYYWCEAYYDPHVKPGAFCMIGQRGLSEYAAKRCYDAFDLLCEVRNKHSETVGWQYGAVMSLRTALEARRKEEMKKPEYMDQMSISVYRVQRNIKHSYKVGTADARATFDTDGFDRGKETPWDLSKFQSPTDVLFHYHNNGVDRPTHFNDKIIVEEVADESGA